MNPAASIQAGGYHIENLSSMLNMQALRAHFDTLPQDPYLPMGVRYKQIVRCRVQGESVIEQDHAPLFQSTSINRVLGDRARRYERFSRLDLVSQVVKQFAKKCGFGADHEVLVQPHRVTCKTGTPGEPAVEGFHRDGIHYIGILCVSRHQICGGESQLARDPSHSIDLEHTLEVGEMLVFDDRQWLHYATSIQAQNQAGHRDVLLLSANPGTVNRA